jgi:hypothetical protein
MHQAMYEELKRVALRQTTVTYSEIAPLADLDMEDPSHRDEIGRLLGEISEHEHGMNRRLLSVLVVDRDNNMPGPGFFKLAKRLRLYDGRDDLKYFLDELKRVHAAWANVAPN